MLQNFRVCSISNRHTEPMDKVAKMFSSSVHGPEEAASVGLQHKKNDDQVNVKT